jgi:hypothetical protein
MFNTSPIGWQKTDENGKMLDDPMIKNVSLGLVSWIWLRIRVQSMNLSFFKYPRVCRIPSFTRVEMCTSTLCYIDLVSFSFVMSFTTSQ